MRTGQARAAASASGARPVVVRSRASSSTPARRVVVVRAQAPAATAVSAPAEAAAPYGVFRLSYDVNNVSFLSLRAREGSKGCDPSLRELAPLRALQLLRAELEAGTGRSARSTFAFAFPRTQSIARLPSVHAEITPQTTTAAAAAARRRRPSRDRAPPCVAAREPARPPLLLMMIAPPPKKNPTRHTTTATGGPEHDAQLEQDDQGRGHGRLGQHQQPPALHGARVSLAAAAAAAATGPRGGEGARESAPRFFPNIGPTKGP
jgi:hypothetical protein